MSGFANPLTGGQGALIYPRIKSPNYMPGVSGWAIERDGSAEFNDATIRGILLVTDPDGSYVKIFNEEPGDGAVIEFRPADTAGTVIVPGRIRTGADPNGNQGMVIASPVIDGGALSEIAMTAQGTFISTNDGAFYVSSEDGISNLLGAGADFDIGRDIGGGTYLGVFQVRGSDGVTDISNPLLPAGMFSGMSVRDFYTGPSTPGTTTSGSYANLPGSTQRSFTKHFDSTDLVAKIGFGSYSTVANSEVEYGVLINGVENSLGPFYFNTANDHRYGTGGCEITGLAAGSYTMRARWRRIAGTGTITLDNHHRITLEVREEP